MSIPSQYVSSISYGDIRFDPSITAPVYIGQHVTKGESADSTDWKITKLTATAIQVAYGSWTNRATYF